MALLLGDTSSAVDVEPSVIVMLHQVSAGSPVAEAVVEIVEAEKAVTGAQARLNAAKRALATALMG